MSQHDPAAQHNEDTHTDYEVGRLKRMGRIVGVSIVLATIVLVLLVAHRMTVHPTTEDASVGAHYRDGARGRWAHHRTSRLRQWVC